MCKLDFCSRPRYSRDGLCRAHADQQRKGTPLRPIAARVRAEGCAFPGCERPHCTHGWCVAHYRQWQRGKEMRAIGSRKPAKTKPPKGTMPPGWDSTTPARKTKAVDKTFYGVPVVPPMHPATLAAALIVLRDTGADDLAEVLGVSPDQIRAEADRWLMWEGVA